MRPPFTTVRRVGAHAMSADGSLGRAARRALNLWRYRQAAARKPLPALRYLIRGRELTNFT